MKKIFTITALAATMITAATSCQKEEFVNQQTQGNGLVFYANLEDGATKTTIGEGNKISWETTDTISINGVKYVPAIDPGNSASATFSKASNETKADPTAPFKAYYPASIYDGTTATLPATQVYTTDGSIAAILPMYAESSSTTNLNFKNLCGLMKFTLKGTETVRSITIKDDTKALSGKFTVSGNAAVLDGVAKGGVSLDCGEAGVLLNEVTGKIFYVAVPAGNYANLHIEYNTVNYAKYAKMKASTTATVERNKVYPFSQTPTFKSDWFYFEAVEADAQIGMTKGPYAPDVSLQYSTNGGEIWNDFTVGSTLVPLTNVGDRVYFKAKGTNEKFANSTSNLNYCNNFTTSANVNVGGNIMYLLNGITPGLTISSNCFFDLFWSNEIVSASDLKLPATTLAERCYYNMFSTCNVLVNAPSLPATTLASSCYNQMFLNCTALVNAPALPATTLAATCYKNMFKGCTALVNAPALPATTLAATCYVSMFYGCTALKTAPALPATTLAESCYKSMFNGCTALVNAPALPATTLAMSCYESMFNGCSALVTAPALPATTLAESCYKSMFNGCTALVNAPALPATTLAKNCYYNMFKGCTALVNAPALPATTLAETCYVSMFESCSNLASVTMLATTIANESSIDGWLYKAGTSGGSHILYVDPSMDENTTIWAQRGNFTVTAYSGE